MYVFVHFIWNSSRFASLGFFLIDSLFSAYIFVSTQLVQTYTQAYSLKMRIFLVN